MPHIIIEHKTDLDTDALARAIHAEAITIDALPIGGIRTRLYACDNALIADGGDENQFCYVTVRLGAGRTEAVKKDIGDRLFAVLTNWADPAFDANEPISLGLEVQEITPGSTWKKNNIHQILKDRI